MLTPLPQPQTPRLVTRKEYLAYHERHAAKNSSEYQERSIWAEVVPGEIWTISPMSMCISVGVSDEDTLKIVSPWRPVYEDDALASHAHPGLLCEWLISHSCDADATRILQASPEARAWVLGYNQESHSSGYVEMLMGSMIDRLQHAARAENARQTALLALQDMG